MSLSEAPSRRRHFQHLSISAHVNMECISGNVCVLGSHTLLLTDHMRGHVVPASGVGREVKCPGGPEAAGALGKALLCCCGGAPGEGTALGLPALALHSLPAGGCPCCGELDQNPWVAMISHRAVGGVCWGYRAEGASVPSMAPARYAGKFSQEAGSYAVSHRSPEPKGWNWHFQVLTSQPAGRPRVICKRGPG